MSSPQLKCEIFKTIDWIHFLLKTARENTKLMVDFKYEVVCTTLTASKCELERDAFNFSVENDVSDVSGEILRKLSTHMSLYDKSTIEIRF